MQAQDPFEQRRRAFHTLTLFNWVSIALCVPLSVLVAAIFAREEGASPGSIAFGIFAFAGSLLWAVLFYRRAMTLGLSREQRAKRLGQAAMTASYPAYLGIAVTIFTGAAVATLPFIAVASFNVAALKRLGDYLLGDAGPQDW